MSAANKRVLIFGIHRTVAWWKYVGLNLGWGESIVVTDLRGEGDVSLVDDFYSELQRLRNDRSPTSTLLSCEEVDEVIGRCRTLRWLDRNLAVAMTLAMAVVLDRVLTQIDPRIVLSFPIDRYVKDVLERLASQRGVPYVELTASVVPGMSMLLRRGALVRRAQEPPAELTRLKVQEIGNNNFVPSYVPKDSAYTRVKFLRTHGYLRVRGLAMRAISFIQRDPLNLHYLDAQPTLGHKCGWKDVRVLSLCDARWRDKLAGYAPDKRVLFGLQVFPEASIDYWIRNIELIENESLVFDAAMAFSNSGYLVLVKDHPLQFGCRQAHLLERLRTLPNVVIVPYDVSATELLRLVGTNFTCTGTLGLQASLAGLNSVVTESYYSNDDDFIVFRSRSEVETLPSRVLQASQCGVALPERQWRLISNLLRGSFDGELFSFKRFDARAPAASVLGLAKSLGRHLDELSEEGKI